MALTEDAKSLLGKDSEKDLKEVKDAGKQSLTDLSRIEDRLKTLKEDVSKKILDIISILEEPRKAFKVREDFFRKRGYPGLTREMMFTQVLLKEIENDLREINRISEIKINDIIKKIEKEMININRELGYL